MSHILVIDDDLFLSQTVSELLRSHGFEIRTAPTAHDGMVSIVDSPPDLLLLDLSLSDDDGINVCRKIRAKWRFPIIMLTSRSDLVDKVMGLEVGADDYLTKPFEARELIARIRACLRRNVEYSANATVSEAIEIGPIKIDSARHRVEISGEPIYLTSLEFRLIEYMAKNAGRVLEREQLFETVWGYKEEFSSNSLDVFMYRLRTKLERSAGVKVIHTVRGLGYRFEVEEPR